MLVRYFALQLLAFFVARGTFAVGCDGFAAGAAALQDAVAG